MQKHLFIFCCLLTVLVKAQNNYSNWIKTVETNHGNTNMNNIVTDGEYLYVNGTYWGEESKFGGNNLPAYDGANGLISKLTTNGEIIWTATFGGNSLDAFYDIKLDNNGNIIAVGWTSSEGELTINENYTIAGGGPEWTSRGIIAKFSGEDGSLIWEKNWYAADYYYANPGKLATDFNGNIYVSGYYAGAFEIDTVPFGYNMNYGDNLFVAKFNADGELIWKKEFEGNEDGTWGNITAMAYNENGLYFTLNYNKPYLLNDVPLLQEGETYWAGVVNVDINTGEVIKHTSFGTATSDQGASSLTIDKEGHIIIGGHFTNDHGFNIQGTSLTGYGSEDGYIAKFDKELQIQWVKAMGGDYLDRVFNVYTNTNNEIFVGGGFDSYTNFQYDNQAIINSQSPNSLSMFELHLTADGEFQNVLALHGNNVYTILSNTASVVLDNGKVYSTARLSGAAVLQEGGELIDTYEHNMGFVMEWDAAFATMSVNNPHIIPVQVYPNPFYNELHIKNHSTTNKISIYNVSGQNVYQNTNLKTNKIDLSHLKPGVYIIKIQNEKSSQTLKIIKK